MKLIPLEQLRQHSALYHQAFEVGRLADGVNVEVPDDFAPSLPMVANNALSALGRVAAAIVRGAPVFVPEIVAVARQAICEDCEHHQAGKCKLCGCCTDGLILNKTKLATEKCPVGKWNTT